MHLLTKINSFFIYLLLIDFSGHTVNEFF